MAAGKTYEPIQSINASGSSTVTFSSIPGTYTDLQIVLSGIYSGTTYGYFSINGSTASISWTRMLSYSGGVLSDRGTNDGASLNNTGFSTTTIDLLNYSNTTSQKSFLVKESTGSAGLGWYIYKWANTAAITSLSITAQSSGTFASGTTITMYGIKAA